MNQDHIKYLLQLKNNGFNPKVIYDIGSCVLEWTKVAKQIWPESNIILFEAFDSHEKLHKQSGYDYHIGVLSDKSNRTVKFYYNDKAFTGNSYYQEKASAHLYENFREVQTYALDDIVSKRNFPLPDFIKIDVQGSEMDIIKGGIKTIMNAKHLIVEMQHEEYNKGAPLVDETLPWIESLGWKCIAPLFAKNYGPDGDYGFINTRYVE